MEWIQFLALPIGYLLGAMPSAYFIGRLLGKTDVRTEGDGKISAAAVYRRVGKLPFLLVVVMDIGKGLLAIVIARLLTGYLVEGIQDIPVQAQIIMLSTGIIAMSGHVWSPFLKFKGGLGATVIAGVLGGTVLFQALIAFAIGALSMVIIHKSGWNTIIVLITACVILIIQNIVGINMPPYVGIYPLILGLIMMAKRFQLKKMGLID